MAAAVRRVVCPGTPLSALWRNCAPPSAPLSPASCASCSFWRCTAKALHLCPSLCAGHNKWSKVKHIKGPKDQARAKIFSKYSLMIRVAVKEGGPNPEFNPNLAHLLEHCRKNNMPKASVEAAIKSAEKAKPPSQHLVEARGPGGCFLLIEVLTDNYPGALEVIKKIVTRRGGMMSDGGRHNFEQRGYVMVSAKGVSTERALEIAIEAGAEDVQETVDDEEQMLKFICEMAELSKVCTSLEQQDLSISSAGLEFVPHIVVPLDGDLLDRASGMILTLSNYSDVLRVWDNIKAST